MRAIDVMVRDVVTVGPDTDVAEAIKLLAEHDVSALPVVDGAGNLIGILGEADLIHRVEIGTEKRRPWWLELLARLQQQSWTDFGSRNVTVSDHVVHLWGLVGAEAERKALVALAEGVPGVARVSDEMIPAY
jgi:CBS-domain-containing membrane protein